MQKDVILVGEPVKVKGNGNKLEFWMDAELTYAELRDALVTRLDVNASFYIGSKRQVVFYGKIFTDAQKRELKSLLSNEYCFNRVSFVDDDAPEPERKTSERKAADDMPQPEKRPPASGEAGLSAHDDKTASGPPDHIFISQTIRSGQRLQTEGDITVIGDVNSGAELVAGGSVAVFGRLSGMVHAGAFGDTSAIIAANRLMASQLRIADKIAVLPAKHKPQKPEIVRFIDGRIVISSIN